MSSSDRTPQSVLDAPHLTPVPVSQQLGIIDGLTRRERRHVTLNAKGERVNPGLGKTFTIPKAARVAATNVPLTKAPKNLRGKKARRTARRNNR
jgi:hypothetical protein